MTGPAAQDGGLASDPHRSKWGTPIRFITRHRARFAEIDSFGHMNTNHYVAYFTENRFIGHRDFMNLDLKKLNEFPVAPYVRKMEIEFIRPVIDDTEFVIESFVSELSDSSCVVPATMKTATDILLATCRSKVVCVNKTTLKQVSWPDDFISLFYKQD